MKTVTFYHSMVCPRCHLTSLFLSGLRTEFPDIEIQKVEYLTNRGRAKKAGVRGIPTLVAGDRTLHSFLLTKGGIRRFFESLQD